MNKPFVYLKYYKDIMVEYRKCCHRLMTNRVEL